MSSPFIRQALQLVQQNRLSLPTGFFFIVVCISHWSYRKITSKIETLMKFLANVLWQPVFLYLRWLKIILLLLQCFLPSLCLFLPQPLWGGEITCIINFKILGFRWYFEIFLSYQSASISSKNYSATISLGRDLQKSYSPTAWQL